MFHWLNMTPNGSPSYVFWTSHVDFQTLRRSILGMCTSKTDMKKMMVVMTEEKKECLVWWIAAGSNYFSKNFGWLLRRGGGEAQNLNDQMTLKNSKIECR